MVGGWYDLYKVQSCPTYDYIIGKDTLTNRNFVCCMIPPNVTRIVTFSKGQTGFELKPIKGLIEGCRLELFKSNFLKRS